MWKKKEWIAMLLAGGQGSRLHVLTDRTAKPAVPFGGKYRIIDFTLTNCINSGIDTVGVLTQYQPLVLNEYIGNGQPWDLDRTFGGVTILPPYQAKKGADWYRGTANAIYQNMRFIDRYDPDYVVVLSGDHIYKMNYNEMLAFHKAHRADCTIGVIDVPIAEASRFGILDTRADGSIERFEEKPKTPKSTKASMGIYIFNRSRLYEYLIEDEADKKSDHDFGKNIIPAMLAGGECMYAYPFSGYWKDVGTLDSLWEANMDLLGEKPALELGADSWKVYSRSSQSPPQFIGQDARIENSLITEGCEIHGAVVNSVLFHSVRVERGAMIRDSVVMENVVVCEGAKLDYAIVDADSMVGKNATVGGPRDAGARLTVVGAEVRVPDGAAIESGEVVSEKDRLEGGVGA